MLGSDAPQEIEIRTRRTRTRTRGVAPARLRAEHHGAGRELRNRGRPAPGKTYLAVACAVEALEAERVRRLVLARPAVEAGERLGFLPGDLAQKVDSLPPASLRRAL